MVFITTSSAQNLGSRTTFPTDVRSLLRGLLRAQLGGATSLAGSCHGTGHRRPVDIPTPATSTGRVRPWRQSTAPMLLN